MTKEIHIKELLEEMTAQGVEVIGLPGIAQLHAGRIPLNEAETVAIDRLLAKHGDGSLTRRDPGETGPVLVHIGSEVFAVFEDGTVHDRHATVISG